MKFLPTHKIAPSWWLPLSVTLVGFVFTYFYYGFYYVEYEALFDSFYSENLTGGMPFRSIYFLGNIGTSYVYSYLYEKCRAIEWISWILYSYLLVSCFIGLLLIHKMLPQTALLLVRALVLMVAYLLVFADHNIHFIFTRVSYLVTGVSLLALLYYFRQPGSIRPRLPLFVFLNAWFVLGVLTRSESATGVFLQLFFLGLVYVNNYRQLLRVWVFPTAFLFCLLGVIAYDLKTSPYYYKQVEPEIEAQFCERENIVALSTMQSARDSAIWQMAANIVWADPKVLTPARMRSFIQNSDAFYTDMRQWKRVGRNINYMIDRFYALVAISLLCSILLFYVKRGQSIYQQLAGLLWVVSFWVLIALQTYTVKVNDRSFAPLISIYILGYMWLLLPHLEQLILHRLVKVIVLAIGFFFVVHLFNLKKESNQLRTDFAYYQKNTEAIVQAARNKVLVVNSSSCDYLFSSNQPFHVFNFNEFKRIYIADGFNIPFLPYYRRYLEKECNCNMDDFPSFWNYLLTKPDEVVIVSTEERMEILKNYMNTVYGMLLPVVPVEQSHLMKLQKSDSRGIFAKLKLYSLKK